MNETEHKLYEILSKDGDVATEILHLCENIHTDELISLCPQLQNELINRLAKNPLEESVWDDLLSIMMPDALSEDVFHYFIQNRISLLTFCHMPLQDKWLMKLTAYDDAPVYTLAKRYYLSDKYSSSDFVQFYHQCLRGKDDISLHLLDVYGNADKRRLLIFLCSNHADFEDREKLQWHRVADQVRVMTDGADIEAVYQEYRYVGIVLTEIASNYFTPDKILSELSSVKGILYANTIRKNSEKTLKLKQIVKKSC